MLIWKVKSGSINSSYTVYICTVYFLTTRPPTEYCVPNGRTQKLRQRYRIMFNKINPKTNTRSNNANSEGWFRNCCWYLITFALKCAKLSFPNSLKLSYYAEPLFRIDKLTIVLYLFSYAPHKRWCARRYSRTDGQK